MATESADDIASLRRSILRLARRLRKHSGIDLTPSQMSALSTLERLGPLRIGELARREDIGKSSVTRLVAKLELMGHVRRHVDPSDARSFSVSLTDHGVELLAKSSELANDFLAAQVRALAPEDKALLIAALPVLDRLVNLRL